MGLVIDEDENHLGFSLEVRRESIILGGDVKEGNHSTDPFSCDHSDRYGWYVEVDKSYLKRLVDFFIDYPEHLL